MYLLLRVKEKTKALRQWRFTDVDQMDDSKIKAYIQEAIQVEKQGLAVAKETTQVRQPSGILQDKLNQDETFRTAFEKLTTGKKNEYMNHIDEAKQETTKVNRLNKIIPLILQGVGLHDKYKK